MGRIRFFTDEDIYGAIAVGLRRAGYDCVTTPEVGRLSQSDESQLAWASAELRVIITFNVAHFVALHRSWMQQSKSHAGIVVSSQRPIGDILRRLLHMASTLDEAVMRNRLEFLSDW